MPRPPLQPPKQTSREHQRPEPAHPEHEINYIQHDVLLYSLSETKLQVDASGGYVWFWCCA